MAVWSWPFLALLCLGNVKFHATEQSGREKRQVSYPQIYQTVKECIEEANNELAIQKQIDKYMMDTGVDHHVRDGGVSYLSHLGRFLYTKNAEKVNTLSDKAWVTVAATKKLLRRTGMTLPQLKSHPGFLDAWRRQVSQSCPFVEPRCDPSVIYRTADGSCNNLNHSSVGAAYTRQRRMMDNSYEDGINQPRQVSCKGGPLPSPRTISNIIHKSGHCSLPSRRLTVLAMQFGQFIEHDVISTPLQRGFNSSDIMCCGLPEEILKKRSQCFPITIPDGDPRFKEHCMSFVRATPGLDKNCDMGVRSPMNQATSYLDGSQIYGVDVDEQLKLRAGVGGLMKMTPLGLPPPTEDPICIQEEPGDYCFGTGDFRVNHVPGLTVMHTIFLRQHNRIATGLALLNLHWDDERIFQETRKIIIGCLQHLVYNSLLPTILRNEDMDRYGLWSSGYGYSSSYNPNEDVSIMMGFSAAAMRFPHTRIPNVQSMVNKDYTVRQDAPIFETFDKPKFVLQHLGKALADFGRWLVSFPVMEDDRFVEDGVRDFLFLDDKGESFDLIALNLQRAREQGIPPYNQWRRLCGLKPALYFSTGPGGLVDHEPDVVKLLSSVYKHPDDIDLFSGGLSEKIPVGAATGPTFACIIATQFKNVKVADRFWYENYNPYTGFTPNQLNEIKKTSLAKIMCENLDIQYIQRDPLSFVSEKNPRVSCQSLPGIDLQYWQEKMKG